MVHTKITELPDEKKPADTLPLEKEFLISRIFELI
jgi:hypothetical protein